MWNYLCPIKIYIKFEYDQSNLIIITVANTHIVFPKHKMFTNPCHPQHYWELNVAWYCVSDVPVTPALMVCKITYLPCFTWFYNSFVSLLLTFFLFLLAFFGDISSKVSPVLSICTRHHTWLNMVFSGHNLCLLWTYIHMPPVYNQVLDKWIENIREIWENVAAWRPLSHARCHY